MTPNGRSASGRHDPVAALVLRLTVVTVAILLLAAGAASWLSLRSFDPLFQPELARKARTVGDLLAAQIDRGLGVRIPLDRMAGLDALLAAEVDRHEDIAYVAVSDPAGHIVAAAGAPLDRRTASAIPADRLDGPADGRLVHGFVDVERSLGNAGAVAGTLHVGIDSAFLAKASTDLALDVLSVVVVSVLLIFELLQLVVNLAMRRVLTLRLLADRAEEGDFRAALPRLSGPSAATGNRALESGVASALDAVNARYAALAARVADLRRRPGAAMEGNDPRVRRAEAGLAALARRFRFRDPGTAAQPPLNLVFLRLPVFLFCLSEELSRPFLPAYAQSFAGGVPWLTPDMVVGLPIALFMLIWALSQPGGARFSERRGRARSFTIGALLGALGLALTAAAGSLYELMVWRCLTALGYGLVLITAQGIVVDHSTPRNRAAGMAMFIGALLAAGVCGPVGGGILADRVGFRATFLLGAVLALGSGLSVALLLRGRAGMRRADGAAPTPAPTSTMTPAIGSALRLFRDLRFSALMVLSAIPTKIASTAFLFCLVPLILTADGASKAEIGRVQMMYFVAFILVSPLAAGLSDRWQARHGFIAAGGIGTLASCLPIVATQALWGPPLAVCLFGLSQALVGAPQLTLVSQIARDSGQPETAAIGWYRLVERLGGALGPVAAMGVAAATSYREAMLGIGLLCGASALLFLLLVRPRKPAAPAARPLEA